MTQKDRNLVLPLLPAAWLFAVPAALLAAVFDLCATPLVLWHRLRKRLPDRAPHGRSASIVIPSWNGRDLLAQLLPSLRVAIERTGGSHETIVVDNGSDDGTAGFLRDEHGWVRVVQLPENRFFVGGVRAGIAAARGDILVLLNNDMRVEPDFLKSLLARFGAADLFAVTGRIEMDGDKVETGRTRITHKKGLLRFEQVDGPNDAPAIPAAWAGGGNAAFDAAKLRALDGMEELYAPCYAEDASLSWLAWKHGWRVEYEPSSVVHHLHRATSTRVFGRSEVEVLDRRNRELMFWRTVTDWRIVLAHVLWLPWNLRKEARRTGYAVQFRALWRAVPRLLTALWLRQRARCTARRSDRDTLRVANDVTAYCRTLGAKPARTRVLVLHTEATAPRFVRESADVEVVHLKTAEFARRAIAERYLDEVVLADEGAVGLAGPWLAGRDDITVTRV